MTWIFQLYFHLTRLLPLANARPSNTSALGKFGVGLGHEIRGANKHLMPINYQPEWVSAESGLGP